MSASFQPVDIAMRERYGQYLQATPQVAADYSFTNLWAWADAYGLQIAWETDLCWIRQTCPEVRYWAPVGDWEKADWTVLAGLSEGQRLNRVPEGLIDHLEGCFPGKVRVEETPGQWEYVYAAEALAELKGNRLHKKRNHVNGFIKAYGLDYRPLTQDGAGEALSIASDWLGSQIDPASHALQAERDAIGKVLRSWDALPSLVGGALYVEDSMIAFCVGEPLDGQTVVVHFEKALSDYRGAFQAVNAAFAKNALSRGFTLINREQDNDDPGLRQAKQSYVPLRQLRKNTVALTL